MADASRHSVGLSSKQKVSPARETMDILMEMSKLLNTGLDGETLMTCVRLCEGGVNPEALALVIKELRRESAAIKSSESSGQSIS
ncbi:mitotic-spindle organizing protein 1-like [Gigantopelta aegis]|uniref:mitotic-spindle organizing protein 1-like n=1 Tax=Gigantopelta aegis TaxID=1735272 RepID=UPI001B889113|nr:mitotic-spindle organizing protein 1-like [Gigantopelta aegis]